MFKKKIFLGVLCFAFLTNLVIAAPAKKTVSTSNKKTVSSSAKTVKQAIQVTVSPLDKKIAEINSFLEKGDYRNADFLINHAIESYPKEVQFKILSAISFVIKEQLDSAQEILDSITAESRVYDSFYYAQGITYLKRVETSDMAYRAKYDEYIDLAIDHFNKAILINPKKASVHNALGVAYLKKKDLYKAESCFRKALEITPRYATALDNLGTVYYITNELNKAEAYFKDAESANPLSSTVYYHLAQVSFKNHDLNKSLYYSNKSLQYNKRSPYVYNLIGEIYRKQGNEAAAINAFKKSILIKPEYTVPYLNLASIFESRGDVSSALVQLKTCYSISPDNDVVKLAIADLDLSSNRYNDAIKYYSMVSDKYKADAIQGIVSAYYSLALESANKSMFRSFTMLNNALGYINDAINRDPDNLELYLTKSKLNKLINNQVESKDVLLKIVSTHNTNISDLLTKAEAYIALQRYRDARNTYTSVIMTSKSLESDLYLAEYLTHNKQYKLAKDALSNVFMQEPDNLDAKRNLAFIENVIARSNQEYNNAIYFNKKRDLFFRKAYLNKAINIDPNNIDANLLLGKILKKEKDIYGASKCYKVVQGISDNQKQIKKVTKISKKLDKKIAKKEARQARKPQLLPVDSNIQPVSNTYKPLINTIEEKSTNINEIDIEGPISQPVGI